MDVSVLGALRVTNAHGPVEIRGAKERALLAHLVAYAGRMVPAADLVDSLWGDDPPRSAAKSLQTYVLRLRNTLEPGRNGSPSLLVTEGPGYRLAVDPECVDAERFSQLVALGRRALADGRSQVAAGTLDQALGMWRGPAYAGFESTSFGQAEARRLEELRLAAIEDRLTAELECGRTSVVVAELERLVAEHPLRERAWGLLALALYRSGRQGDALGALRRASEVLADELGIDPGPELRELQKRMLAQDATLDGPRRAARLPAGLVAPPGPLLGRVRELEVLRSAWRRVTAGAAATVVISGPVGSGRTRLAAALAADVAESGGDVVLVDPRSSPPPPPADGRPTLVVADRAPAPRAARCVLVVQLLDSAAPVPADVETITLTPLGHDDVLALVRSYVGEGAARGVAAEVLGESGGWPGAVHDCAIRLARQAAAGRVEDAAVRADLSSVSLSSARADLTAGVVALQEIAASAPIAPDCCPWRGLHAYDVSDAPWFAGRERLVAELVSRLAGARLVAVVGASGSGKSSAVRAGLLAALADDVLPGSAAWTHIVMRPGEHPMRELARKALGSRQVEVGDLLGQLIRAQDSTSRVVLVVDQLEELWTACGDDGERAAFLDTLVELTADADAPVTVVLVTRADFVGELAEHSQLATRLADATVLVGAPTPPEVRRAVERPADRAGLVLDDGLADAMVTDAGSEPGLLPLLSSSLTQLWEQRDGNRLTFAAYVATGGLSGAIAHLAEETYTTLPPGEQAAVRLLLLRLTGPGEGAGVTRRRVPLGELSGLPTSDARGAVEVLAAARLLTVSDGFVEVAHESLFREWPRLRGWLVEDSAGREVQRRLAVAASEWVAEGREPTALWRGTRLAAALEVAEMRPQEITATEREFLEAGRSALDADRRAADERAATASRQNRRLRWLLGGVVALLTLAVLAGLLATRARSQAQAATRSADARRLAATALNEDYPDLALLKAVEAVRVERSPDTYGALLTLIARSPDLVTRVRTPDRFLRMGVSADGRTVYLADNVGRLQAVDAMTGRAHWTVTMPEAAQAAGLVPSPDGARLLVMSLGEGLRIMLVDASDGRALWTITTADARAVAGEDADDHVADSAGWLAGDRIVFSTVSHVFTADAASGRVTSAVRWPDAIEFPHDFLAWPDGRVSITVTAPDKPPRPVVFDPGQPDAGFRALPGIARAVSSDGRRIAAVTEAGDSRTLRVYDARKLRPAGAAQRVVGDLRSAEFGPGGGSLLTAVDETVQLRSGVTGEIVREFTAHSGAVLAARFAGPDRDLVWTSGRDGTAVALDLTGRLGPVRSRRIETAPHVGETSARGDVAVMTPFYETRTNPGHLIDATTGEDLHGELPLPSGCDCQVAGTAMTDDGTTALGAITEFDKETHRPLEDRGHLVAWDARTGRLTTDVRLPWPAIGVAATSDGSRAVINGSTGVAVVDLRTRSVVGRPLALSPTEAFDGTPTVAVTPDGRVAAVGRLDRVLLVDVATGGLLREATLASRERVLSLTWSADGRTLVAGGFTGQIHFLGAADLTPVAVTRLITGGWVIDLEVSPDGRLLASMGTDGDVTLWDTRSWSPIGKPVLDKRTWGFLSFTEGGRGLRVYYEDKGIAEISTDPSAWLRAACAAANRDMTADEWAVAKPGEPHRSTCADLP